MRSERGRKRGESEERWGGEEKRERRKRAKRSEERGGETRERATRANRVGLTFGAKK
jgi:hypothetical protein